jgi:SAM-dependent methyltransferase
MVKDTAAANDRAIQLLALDVPSTVLDLGCGQGRTIAALVRAGHRAVGVDPSPTMANQASARNRSAVRRGDAKILSSDGRELPLADDTVDHSLTTHTVYFMPDPAATIGEVARVMRPGGRFVLACHVGDDPLPAWADPDVYRMPTRDQLRRMLDEAGFSRVGVVPGDVDAAWRTYWFVAELPHAPNG